MAKKKETKKDIVEKIKVGFDKLLLGNIGLIVIPTSVDKNIKKVYFLLKIGFSF